MVSGGGVAWGVVVTQGVVTGHHADPLNPPAPLPQGGVQRQTGPDANVLPEGDL